MNDQLFRRILFIIIALCIVGTITFVAYSLYLRADCSIISYISNESW